MSEILRIGKTKYMKSFDVIILDSVGVAFSGDSPQFNGLGGSEFEQILLAEGLKASGVSVACINRLPSWCKVRGADYIPIEMVSYDKFECKSLILERSTPVPHENIIKSSRIFRWLTDAGEANNATNGEVRVFVSKWQLEWIGGVGLQEIIHNMLPDWVYDIKPNRNTKANSFIYASAAMKGLTHTLNYFASMKKTREFKNATLKVLNPGYDLPSGIEADGVTFLGALPFHRVVEEMQTCRSFLHISTFKETFGIVHVLAEVLGLNVFVHQATGQDALREVCNSRLVTNNAVEFNQNMEMFGRDPQAFKPEKPNDYRVSSLIPKWLKVLGLPYAMHLDDGNNNKQALELLVQPG